MDPKPPDPDILRQRSINVGRRSEADQRPGWVVALGEAAAQLRREDPQRYGTDAGATIGNAWNATYTMFGIPMVCLLVEGRPTADTDAIPTVVTLPGPAALDRIRRILALGGSMPAFVHDGRSGHAVTLTGLETATDRFRYHDPWPGDSLLCVHQNAAGVDAQPYGDKEWSVTGPELALILVGVLVMPSFWDQVNGGPGPVRYADLAGTDFWTFFGLHEHERTPTDDGRVRIVVHPGNFADSVVLGFQLDAHDRVTRATLSLREGWALGEPFGVNPFGLDIASHFIGTLTPRADLAAADLVRPGLDLCFLRERYQDPAFQSTAAGQLMIAYLGGLPDVTLVFTVCSVHVERRGEPADPWIDLVINTF